MAEQPERWTIWDHPCPTTRELLEAYSYPGELNYMISFARQFHPEREGERLQDEELVADVRDVYRAILLVLGEKHPLAALSNEAVNYLDCTMELWRQVAALSNEQLWRVQVAARRGDCPGWME